MSGNQVLLTAGFARAPHVLALAELLRRDNVHVAGLLVVSPFSVKRVRSYVRQRGVGFVKQAVPRLLGRRTVATAADEDELEALLAEEEIERVSLPEWAQAHNVPCQSVKSINSDESIAFLRTLSPDWVAYGGGGILHDAFIDAADGRILNAHSGPMPEIRGMNACEWSLLLGYEPTVTIHVINRGIDTGGIIAEYQVPVRPEDTLDRLRSRCAAIGVRGLRDVLKDPPATLPSPRTDAAAHRQCFVLAPALKELLTRRLRALQVQRDR